MNTEKREFAAHIRINEEGEREVQSIEEHNRAVAEMAEGFAECFGQSDLAYAIGRFTITESTRMHFRKESGTTGRRQIIRPRELLDL